MPDLTILFQFAENTPPDIPPEIPSAPGGYTSIDTQETTWLASRVSYFGGVTGSIEQASEIDSISVGSNTIEINITAGSGASIVVAAAVSADGTYVSFPTLDLSSNSNGFGSYNIAVVGYSRTQGYGVDLIIDPPSGFTTSLNTGGHDGIYAAKSGTKVPGATSSVSPGGGGEASDIDDNSVILYAIAFRDVFSDLVVENVGGGILVGGSNYTKAGVKVGGAATVDPAPSSGGILLNGEAIVGPQKGGVRLGGKAFGIPESNNFISQLISTVYDNSNGSSPYDGEDLYKNLNDGLLYDDPNYLTTGTTSYIAIPNGSNWTGTNAGFGFEKKSLKPDEKIKSITYRLIGEREGSGSANGAVSNISIVIGEDAVYFPGTAGGVSLQAESQTITDSGFYLYNINTLYDAGHTTQDFIDNAFVRFSPAAIIYTAVGHYITYNFYMEFETTIVSDGGTKVSGTALNESISFVSGGGTSVSGSANITTIVNEYSENGLLANGTSLKGIGLTGSSNGLMANGSALIGILSNATGGTALSGEAIVSGPVVNEGSGGILIGGQSIVAIEPKIFNPSILVGGESFNGRTLIETSSGGSNLNGRAIVGIQPAISGGILFDSQSIVSGPVVEEGSGGIISSPNIILNTIGSRTPSSGITIPELSLYIDVVKYFPPLPSDIEFFLSGGLTNSDPTKSLGGAVSTANADSGLFDDFKPSETLVGSTEYRCIYLFNRLNVPLVNVKVWLERYSLSSTGIIFGINESDDIQEISMSFLSGVGTVTFDFDGNDVVVNGNANLDIFAQNIQDSLRNNTNLTEVEISGRTENEKFIFSVLFTGLDGNRNQPFIALKNNNLAGSPEINIQKIQSGSPINAVAEEVADEKTAPTEPTFKEITESSPISLALGVDEGFPLWVKRTIAISPDPTENDRFTIKMITTPIEFV